jgi:hypothetical protein
LVVVSLAYLVPVGSAKANRSPLVKKLNLHASSFLTSRSCFNNAYGIAAEL